MLKETLGDYRNIEANGLGVPRRTVRGMQEHDGTDPGFIEERIKNPRDPEQCKCLAEADFPIGANSTIEKRDGCKRPVPPFSCLAKSPI